MNTNVLIRKRYQIGPYRAIILSYSPVVSLRQEVTTLALPRAPYMHAFGFVTPEDVKPGPDANYKFAVLVHHPFYMDLTKEFPIYKLPMEEIWDFDTKDSVINMWRLSQSIVIPFGAPSGF